MSRESEAGLERIAESLQAELIVVEASRSIELPVVGDTGLPFVAPSMQAYEVRLIGLREAVIGVKAYEHAHADAPGESA